MKSPKNARRGRSNAIPGTSRPIFEIDLPDQFRVHVRRLPKAVRKDVAMTIERLRGTFGRPHLHGGIGIRKLKRNYFDCRVFCDAFSWLIRQERSDHPEFITKHV